MAKKFKPTVELIEGVLARVPEGFIYQSNLKKRIKLVGRKNAAILNDALQGDKVGRVGNILYDAERLSAQSAKELKTWCNPSFPLVSGGGNLSQQSIEEQIIERDERLESYDPAARAILDSLEDGYRLVEAIADEDILQRLLDDELLLPYAEFVYDPLQLSEGTMQNVQRQHELKPIRDQIAAMLEERTGNTMPREALYEKFPRDVVNEIASTGGFSTFSVKMKAEPYSMVWVRSTEGDMRIARSIAEDAVAIKDEDWEEALEFAGETLRYGATDGNNHRLRTLARTYTPRQAANRLALDKNTVEQAIHNDVLPVFVDPENKVRIPAAVVEQAFTDARVFEAIATYETLSSRSIAMVSGLSFASVRRRLSKSGASRREPEWGEVRGRWSLPKTYSEFLTKLAERQREEEAEREAEYREQQRLFELQQAEERRQRQMLRERLMEAFPTWKHDRRGEQHISLHIGPPNSGKTHQSLEALGEVGSGWYLAPLRLLAYEVFDRMNRRGIRCNLLTGEEHIPVEGAQITAATIEMLNPSKSGECVVIDETQMLADPDRGWAWTRALMEAEAPEIHVIGPETAENLVEKLAKEGGISTSVIHHERLTPLGVADEHWPLESLPSSTILVAFSRRMVLHLKTELERMGRTVSVIYGGLPPEVRRKQADRFAAGETEICVATDAVGMGLNLPADYVCFYEVEKFDGYDMRPLNSAEVHQIGGRAGRYGLRQSGLIGATTADDLAFIREMFHTPVPEINHARIAPSVTDLELVPGSFWQRLEQWAQLSSIPESLREIIKTADLDERIELARMLTDEEVDQLGLEAALKLVNAPTRRNSRSYWYSCTQSILKGWSMPEPPRPPEAIKSSADLETYEESISCADIYLWLGSRREFSMFALDEENVRHERQHWSIEIDEALLRQIDTLKRCMECGRPVRPGHRFRICDRCFQARRRRNRR